jgi:glycine/D-amino acid oxidase-like deaminating enzyme
MSAAHTSRADELPPSLWAATAAPAPATVPLAGEHRADIVIIGAGYTGLSAALHLAEAGLDTVVLEAHELGWGASGRNGGQIIPGTKYSSEELIDRFGPEKGRPLAAFAERTADLVFDLVARHGIDCDAARTGWIRAAHSRTALDALARQADGLAARGEPVALLDRAEAARLLGTDGYVGGLLDRRGGRLQPLSYARGLARAAQRLGARLHTRSPARGLRSNGTDWEVATPGGSLRARRVLLATNAYTDDLWPGLRRSVIPVHSVQVATGPLPPRLREYILPQGHVVADMRRLLLYFRLDAEGRLIFGGRGSLRESSMGGSFAFAERQMRRLFPAAAGLPRQYAWAGQVALTMDVLPHVWDLAPGLTAALGYNGRGVGMASALGKALARYIAEDRVDTLPFPREKLRPIPLHALRTPMLAAATQYYRLRDFLGL